LGTSDYSASPITGAMEDVFDPLERGRLRHALKGAEVIGRSLRSMTLTSLARQVSFAAKMASACRPWPVCLEEAIRYHLPTYAAAFLALTGTGARIYRWPPLQVFERVMERMAIHAAEDDIQVGLFRVLIPNCEMRSFREAFANAPIHRDYTRLGATCARWENQDIVVSNPDGCVEGVSPDTVLVMKEGVAAFITCYPLQTSHRRLFARANTRINQRARDEVSPTSLEYPGRHRRWRA
jgi:ATP-dependent DNA helicase RecG